MPLCAADAVVYPISAVLLHLPLALFGAPGMEELWGQWIISTRGCPRRVWR